MNKTATWVILAIVLLIGGMWVIRQANTGATDSTLSELSSPVSESDHKRGDGDIALVEYSDFQCPACSAYYPLIKKIEEDFKGELFVVYRHFPLSQHQNAIPSALASEAAGLQGKFFEMHDMLFDNQVEWSESTAPKEIFKKYAENLGLDVQKFEADMELPELQDKISADFQSGIKSNVNATPTFFLDGKKIQNPRSYEKLKGLIEAIINESSS